jgi:hypothetical protein
VRELGELAPDALIRRIDHQSEGFGRSLTVSRVLREQLGARSWTIPIGIRYASTIDA